MNDIDIKNIKEIKKILKTKSIEDFWKNKEYFSNYRKKILKYYFSIYTFDFKSIEYVSFTTKYIIFK